MIIRFLRSKKKEYRKKKARRRVYLQSDHRDIERHADDTAEQGKRIHPFVQKDETD